jgi:signal transduction histidine kinase/DNA-binding response OmpR family regulator
MHFFFLSLLLLYTSTSYSQIRELDSLYQLLECQGDEEKVSLHNEIGLAFLKINLDSAQSHALVSLAHNEANSPLESARSNMILGKINLYRGQLEMAIEYYTFAKRFFNEIPDKSGLSQALNRTGLCYLLIENFEQAPIVLDSALNLAKEATDSVQIIRAYLNISSLHSYTNQPDSALTYLYKAIRIIELTGNDELKTTAYLNLGNLYLNRGYEEKAMKNLLIAAELCERSTGKERQLSYCFQRIGYLYLNKGDTLLAGHYGQKSLDNTNQASINASLVATYSLIGKAALIEASYEKALEYCSKSLAVAEKLQLPKLIADCNYDFGDLYLKMGRYQEAASCLRSSMEVFRSMKDRHSYSKSLNLLAETYANSGDYEKAFGYQLQHDLLQDTILSEENEQAVLKLETEFNVVKKDAQLELQDAQILLKNEQIRQQKIINIVIGIIAVLLASIALLAYFNIKRRKKTNLQLQALDRAKNRFFTDVSHEMRNPLSLILAPLENLTHKTKGSNLQKEIELAYTNSRKLLERVNEILDLSKLESGTMQLNNSPVLLDGFCRRVFFAYESLAYYRKMKLNYKFVPQPLLTIRTDIEKVEKILNNLILNVFRHADSHGELQFHVTGSNKELMISVSDTGQGIEPDELEHIFERYYQAADGSGESKGGSGIGLTLAREYARLIGGDLQVESRPGIRTTFTLTIPFEETDPIQHNQAEEDAPSSKHNIAFTSISLDKKPRVLIVEDEIEMSRFLLDSLSDSFQCDAAPDGQEALKQLKQHAFDLIISDVMMPKMDGMEFREKVRKDSKWKQIPFIMLTAKSLEADRIAGLKLGIDDYITKPFNLEELRVRIDNLILNKQERDNYLSESSAEDQEETLTAEEGLLKKAKDMVLLNMEDPDLNVNFLAEQIGYSQRQLERIFKKNCGLSPGAFIREIRLQRAYQILESRQFSTVKEVCYVIGMTTPSTFSTLFKQRFGKSPKEL